MSPQHVPLARFVRLSTEISLASLATLLALFAVASSSYAATSQDLYRALGLADEQVTAHSLTTSTETSVGTCVESTEEAIADADAGEAILSNGLASDGGTADFDWPCDAGQGLGRPDATQFQLTLEIPEGSRSFLFRAGFSTTELNVKTNVDDRAMVFVDWPNRAPIEVDLSDSDDLQDSITPWRSYALNVEDVDSLDLSFRVEDNLDGRYDSALRLGDFRFSEDPAPADVVDLGPEDQKLPPSAYRHSQTLLSIPGRGIPLDFSIHYNARNLRTRYFFRKWTHSYEWALREITSEEGDPQLQIVTGDGGGLVFCESETEAGFYRECNTSQTSSFDSLADGRSGSVTRLGNGSYEYTDRSQKTYAFSSTGLLQEIRDLNDNSLRFTHFNSGYGLYYIDTIVDTRGATLQLYYTTDPTDFRRKALVSMEYCGESGSPCLMLTTTYTLTQDCFNRQVLDLTFVDGLEGRTLFEYDCRGNILSVTDPDGIETKRNSYSGDRLVETRNGEGAARLYQYVDGTMTSTDAEGNQSLQIYDSNDLLVERTNALGGAWSYEYDDEGQLVTTTDPLGGTTDLAHDARGNVVTSTDASGAVSEFEYDTDNRVLSTTDPLDRSSLYEYDAAGNLIRETDPNGESIEREYDEHGSMVAEIDRSGGITRFGFDPLSGDLNTLTDPLGNESRFETDWRGRVTATTTARGHRQTFQFDRADNLVSRVRADGETLRYSYDAHGRKTENELPRGGVTRFAYNSAGRLTELVDALGASTRFEYDGEDRLIERSDPLGQISSFEYNAAGNLVRAIDPTNAEISASYDAAGRRIELIDALGGRRQFERDAVGRVIRATDPLGRSVLNEYDDAGQIVQTTNRRGQSIRNEYDLGGRISRVETPEASWTHQHDANGNALETLSDSGQTIVRTFDALDRQTTRTDVNGHTVGYEFDATGNLSAIVYPGGDRVEYLYDELERLIRVVDWQGRETTYAYDLDGNLAEERLSDGSVVEREYDLASQLLAQIDRSADGSTLYQVEHQYDARGMRTLEDALISPLVGTPPLESLELTYDAADQISTVNGSPVDHDADGNLVRAPIDGASLDFAYDGLNQLTTAGPDRFEYDADGLRVSATIGGRALRYVWDSDVRRTRLLEERDQNGTLLARYVYGLGLVSRHTPDGSVRIYHFDSRGSTIAMTDEAGALTDRYAYDPYGRKTGRSGATPNPFTYGGRDGVLDDQNGLYFMKVRSYSPELMRFLQRDPDPRMSMLDPTTLNLYAYARGNPVMHVDSDGEFIITAIVVGFAVGVASEVLWDIAFGGYDPRNESFLDYAQANAVDLAVSGVLGTLGPIGHARKLKKMRGAIKQANRYLKAKPLMKVKAIRQWTKGVGKRTFQHARGAFFTGSAKTFFRGLGRGLVKGFMESAVLEWFAFPRLGVDGWSDAGSAVGEFASDTVEDIGEYSESLYDDHIEGTFVDEKIIEPIGDFFNDINPF